MKRRTFLWTSALGALGTLLSLRWNKPRTFCLPGITRADVRNVNGIVFPRAAVEIIPRLLRQRPVPVYYEGRLIGEAREAQIREDGRVSLRGLLYRNIDCDVWKVALSAKFTGTLDGNTVIELHSLDAYTVVAEPA